MGTDPEKGDVQGRTAVRLTGVAGTLHGLPVGLPVGRTGAPLTEVPGDAIPWSRYSGPSPDQKVRGVRNGRQRDPHGYFLIF